MIEAAKFVLESKNIFIALFILLIVMVPIAIRVLSTSKVEIMLLSKGKKRWNKLQSIFFISIGVTAYSFFMGYNFWYSIGNKNVELWSLIFLVVVGLFLIILVVLAIILVVKKIKSLTFGTRGRHVIASLLVAHLFLLLFMFCVFDTIAFVTIFNMTSFKGNEFQILTFVVAVLIPGVIFEGYLKWARLYGVSQAKRKVLIVSTDVGELYYLTPRDDKLLLLGDQEDEEKCTKIYLYNIEQGKIVTTMKIEDR